MISTLSETAVEKPKNRRETVPVISVLFSTAVTIIILNSYTDIISVVYVLPVFACEYFVFRFCEYCRSGKFRFRYLLAFAVVLALAFRFAIAVPYDSTFYQWIMINLSFQDYALYFVALFIICCFAAASVVYYFTVIVYRSLFLFVVLLIPFAINHTRFVSVPAVYTIIAIGLYFTLMIIFGNKDFADAAVRVKRKYLHVFTVSICLLASLSFLIDLPTSTRSQAGRDNMGGSDFSGLLNRSRYSGSADANRNNDEILFLVEADEQLYFIRQVFLLFDGTRWIFNAGYELNSGDVDWEETAESLNFDRLFRFALDADDAQRLRTQLKHRGSVERLSNAEQIKNATIIPQGNHAAAYILAPTRTFGVSGLPRGLMHSRDRLGGIAPGGRIRTPYEITYYRDTFRWDQDFKIIADQSVQDFENLVYDLTLYARLNDGGISEYSETADSFWDELVYARQISEYSRFFRSAGLESLAAAITEGISSDYEKAEAIERYFLVNGYKYDTAGNFVIENDDIEHFVFESQSGTCGHYATAMTLMARMAGLNARYAEGFTSTEINDDGQYVIRAKHSHAFVQVHIPFYGWVTFDPTVPIDDAAEGNVGFVVSFASSFRIFLGFSIFIMLGFMGYSVYTRIVTELLLRRKAAKAGGSGGIIIIYGRILNLVGKKHFADNVSAAMLNKIVNKEYGIDITPISSCFERALFGGESISPKERDDALVLYKQLYPSIKQPFSRHNHSFFRFGIDNHFRRTYRININVNERDTHGKL